MKFFTTDCDTDDALFEERSASYESYVDTIYEALPWPVKLLASEINLHDGFFNKALYAPDASQLELEGIFGDLEMGYFFLHLRYLGLDSTDELKRIFNGEPIEVLDHEIELLASKSIIHRLRFSNHKVLKLEFNNLELHMRHIEAVERFVEKPCQLRVIS